MPLFSIVEPRSLAKTMRPGNRGAASPERHEGEVYAISDRCSHRCGPLHEGELHDGCVTCPLQGSVFKLEDGSVVQGPAAYPQPRWEARVRDGMIEIKAP